MDATMNANRFAPAHTLGLIAVVPQPPDHLFSAGIQTPPAHSAGSDGADGESADDEF